nr:immunoglobulin light chain junction region [Macaca mulatta]
CQQYYSTPYSL